MLANDMKRGTMGILRNGFNFRIADNQKGMIRRATVYGAEHGFSDEMGTIYIHDIALVDIATISLLKAVTVSDASRYDSIELTPDQLVKSKRIKAAGF